MLRVRSFEIADADGINELLAEYHLAGGANILVSDGKVCIPFEDGEPDTVATKVSILKAQRNATEREKAIILQAQKGLEQMIEDKKQAVAALEVTHKGKPNDKEAERKYKEAQNGLDQLNNQYLMNVHDIRRFDINLAVELFPVDVHGQSSE